MDSSENTHYKNDLAPSVCRCGDLAFDFASRAVIRPDKRTNLPEAYFNALVVLLESNGKLVPKAELARVAGTSEDTLYKVIEILRKALGDTEEPRRLILTERGLGYRFVGGTLSKAGEAMANGKASRKRRNALLAVASALCLIGVMVAAFYWNAKPVATVRLDGQFLVAYDASGKTLWRHFFEQGIQSYRYGPASMSDLSWIGDLDGKQAVLFAYSPDSEAAIAAKMSPSSRLLCFSRRGRLEWSFQVGRKLRDTKVNIFPPFNTSALRVVSSSGPHPLSRIIVASGHPTDQAFQLAFLDSNGKLRAEYWHPGVVDHLLILRNPNGSPRLIAAGVNNGEHQATMVELDPFAMKGASTPFTMKDQHFKLLDMPEAHEDLVVLFPRTCLSEKAPYTRVLSIDAHDHGLLVVEKEDYKGGSDRLIYYDFDSSLRLTRAFVSSQFREEHMKLEQAGLVNHSWRQDQALISTGLIYRPKAP